MASQQCPHLTYDEQALRSQENVQHRKYAKWKAAYIHNCLKNGETPQSGPVGMEDELLENESKHDDSQSPILNKPTESMPAADLSNIQVHPCDHPPSNFSTIQIPPGAHAPANTPAEVPGSSVLQNTPTIQPVPQNVPIIDPSLYSVKAQGKIRNFSKISSNKIIDAVHNKM
ncbi:vacuolar protein sorting-associated protein VTA1 homolog [Rhincodon typus]|uniref:vacuolar protein sorting-associated protein VTA1 homolog n=1 Tax=Rhincodon typus TaxID=259920 RepID=UPI002030D2C6|nr:vacuolar protein sorting-associated protein VTA1 homolog [Rhincodon typus]